MSTLVQRGSWPGWANADIYADPATASAFADANHEYMTVTGRVGAEIAEPVGGLRTSAQVAAMAAAFDSHNAAALHFWNMDPASTARPSMSSPHLSGLCLDIYAGDFGWWINNGPRYGLVRTLVGYNDLHHFQFKPGTRTAGTTSSKNLKGTPTMTGPMQIRNEATGEIGLVDLSGYRKVTDLRAASVLIPLAENLETDTPARPWTGYNSDDWAATILAVTGQPRDYWDTHTPGTVLVDAPVLDIDRLASELVPLLAAALPTLTVAEVETATEQALRAVLGGLDAVT